MKYKHSSFIALAFSSLVLLHQNCHHEVNGFSVQQQIKNNNKQIQKRRTKLDMVATTPPSKYPTQRGTTIDSRRIVSQGLAATNLKAIRLKHILFASEELATSSLNELRSAGLFFDDLARQISNCAESRDEGGEIGWVNFVADGVESEQEMEDMMTKVKTGSSDVNEHLDLLLPREARNEVLRSSSKVRCFLLHTHNTHNTHNWT